MAAQEETSFITESGQLFQPGKNIIISQGHRKLKIGHFTGRTLLCFQDTWAEKSFILSEMDFYFLMDHKRMIEEAIKFKNLELHQDCFGIRATNQGAPKENDNQTD